MRLASRLLRLLRRVKNRHPALAAVLRPALSAWKRAASDPAHQGQIIVDRLAESLVRDPVMHVAEFNGIFELDPRSDLFRRLVQFGKYEPELVNYCNYFAAPDRDVIDIGANIGFYSVLLAKTRKATRVLAIEPTPRALTVC